MKKNHLKSRNEEIMNSPKFVIATRNAALENKGIVWIDVEELTAAFIDTVSWGINQQGLTEILFEKSKPHDYKRGREGFRCSQAGACEKFIRLEDEYDRLKPEIRKLIELKIHNDKKIKFGETFPGTAAHSEIERGLKVARYHNYGTVQLIDSETEVTQPLDLTHSFSIGGHYDHLLRWQDRLFIADVKTVNPKHWKKQIKKLETKKFILEEYLKTWVANDNGYYDEFEKLLDGTIVKMDNLTQLSCYQKMMGKLDGLIIYLNKQTWEVVIWFQPYIESLYISAMEKFEILQQSRNEDTIPQTVFKEIKLSEKINKYPCVVINEDTDYRCKFFKSPCYTEGEHFEKDYSKEGHLFLPKTI